MNNRALSRKLSVFLVCFAFCGQQAFAAEGAVGTLDIVVLAVVDSFSHILYLGMFLLAEDVHRLYGTIERGQKRKGFVTSQRDEAVKKCKELETENADLEEKKHFIEEKATELESLGE